MTGETQSGLRAELLFIDPAGPAPMLHLAKPSEPDPVKTLGSFVPVEVTIRDGRPLTGRTTLDEEGFVFVRHASAVTDFYDDAQIRERYYPEMAALVRRLTGARKAVVFDHTVRGTQAGPRGGIEVELPSDMMHCDFTPRAALETLDWLIPPAERAALNCGRIVQLNLWRPIAAPLRTMPLAVCDARSIHPEDCIATPLVRPDFASEFVTLAHDPGQHWFYLPAMRTDEVIVFKNYDSDPAKSPYAIHGAFADPTTPTDALPRESIEVRAFAAI